MKLMIEPTPTLANVPELFKKLGELTNQNNFVRDELVDKWQDFGQFDGVKLGLSGSLKSLSDS